MNRNPMMSKTYCRGRNHGSIKRVAGFTLVEILIALVLGLLVTAGMLTLFSSTSKTNRVQDGLARVQENGRYAMTRIERDLRMLGGQFRTNNAGVGFTSTANGPIYPAFAPVMNAAGFIFTDAPGGGNGAGGSQPNPATPIRAYPLSPRWFVQGYTCSSGTCSPTVPASLPAVGTSDGSRLKGTDLLTVRYQRGTGWSYTVAGTGATTAITLVPRTDIDDAVNFQANDLALLSDCSGSMIFKVTVAGNVLTATGLSDASKLKPSPGTDTCDPRVFNFTRDMVTVTYWVRLTADASAAGRMIPVLMRRENGVDQELVQGVDRLDFLYGVQDKGGGMRYLTASDLETASTAANCAPPPAGVTLEPTGCLWRSITSVEVHALLNTANNINSLKGPELAYRYAAGTAVPSPWPATGTTPTAPGSTITPTGLAAGSMMRREFVSLISVRNGNP